MTDDMTLRCIYTALRNNGIVRSFVTAGAFFREYIKLETDMTSELEKIEQSRHQYIIQRSYNARVAAIKSLVFNSHSAFRNVASLSEAQLARKLRGKFSKSRSEELAKEVIFIMKRVASCR